MCLDKEGFNLMPGKAGNPSVREEEVFQERERRVEDESARTGMDAKSLR